MMEVIQFLKSCLWDSKVRNEVNILFFVSNLYLTAYVYWTEELIDINGMEIIGMYVIGEISLIRWMIALLLVLCAQTLFIMIMNTIRVLSTKSVLQSVEIWASKYDGGADIFMNKDVIKQIKDTFPDMFALINRFKTNEKKWRKAKKMIGTDKGIRFFNRAVVIILTILSVAALELHWNIGYIVSVALISAITIVINAFFPVYIKYRHIIMLYIEENEPDSDK